VRFPSRRGGKLGFVSGDLGPDGQKEGMYFDPAYKALHKCGLQREAIDALLKAGVFDFRTDVRLRGDTIERAFVIVDEAQNAQDVPELELVLTRFTDSVRAAIIGDSRQVDNNVVRYGSERLNAFQVFTRHMATEKWARQFFLSVNYRGMMAKHAAAVDITLKGLG
jgi:predicted ribonuclease YlaK